LNFSVSVAINFSVWGPASRRTKPGLVASPHQATRRELPGDVVEFLFERAGENHDRVHAGKLGIKRPAGLVGSGLELEPRMTAAGVADCADAEVADELLTVFMAGPIEKLDGRRRQPGFLDRG